MAGSMAAAGVLPANVMLPSSPPLDHPTFGAKHSSNWRGQLVAPPARETCKLPALPRENTSQQRQWILPAKSEPENFMRNWTRKEAMDQKLIYRIMFTEEPRWLTERRGYKRHVKSGASTTMFRAADSEKRSVCASYGGVTKHIQLHQGCCDEMAEQLVREAFDLCPERVICLRDRDTGAVTAAKTQIAEGVYEVITDEDQDVAGHLPVQSLHSHITRSASKAAVKDALQHCGLAHILPHLKHMSGAKLLSMPLDVLQDMYAMSGWRLRAVRSLYRALHPPVRIRIDDAASGEGAVIVQVTSAKEFSELLGAQNCVALRASGAGGNGHLAIRFEDLRQGQVYSPVRADYNPFGVC